MTKFNINVLEHYLVYYTVTADTFADAIEFIQSGEVEPKGSDCILNNIESIYEVEE